MIEPLNGVVVVDKPVGPTSFAIVRQARQATGARKVGHGGTLDPLASGVLPICFGEGTKVAQFLLDADKEYEATIAFGIETDTYDAAGKVTARHAAGHLSARDISEALMGFLGSQQQIPPMYSALKREGRPLYSYARAGQTVERQARTVRIHALELRAFRLGETGQVSQPIGEGAPPVAASLDGPKAEIFIRCAKGTYVRSLANDLGRALNVGAHLAALRRVRSGPFVIDDAIAPAGLGAAVLPMVSPAEALRHLSSVTVSEEAARALIQGRRVAWKDLPRPAGRGEGEGEPIRMMGPGGDLVAVAFGNVSDEFVRTMRVFNTPETSGGTGDVGGHRPTS